MKYTIDMWNNFVRVFILPEQYPKGFLFDGAKPVVFEMIDWFQLSEIQGVPSISKQEWIEKYGSIETIERTEDELRQLLEPFITQKPYYENSKEYLIICRFGFSLMIGEYNGMDK